MITLGLDTTGSWCSAALVDQARVLSQRAENIGRGHAERLAPMVSEILSQADIKPGDIQRIAVCSGPGSFTGLRVALAFARSFALPQRIPVIGISALEVIGSQIDPYLEKRVISVMDVRRGELCWAAYERGHEVRPPTTQNIEAAKSEISKLKFDVVVGDGCAHLGLENPILRLSAPALAWLSMDRNGETHPPTPLYSRPPDAKLPGGRTP